MVSDHVATEEAKALFEPVPDQSHPDDNSFLRALENKPRFLKHVKWATSVIVLCAVILTSQVIFFNRTTIWPPSATAVYDGHFPPVYEAPERETPTPTHLKQLILILISVPKKLVVFEENPEFAGPPSLSTNRAWQSIFPSNYVP